MPGLFDNSSSPNIFGLLGAQFAPNAYNAAQGQQQQHAIYNALLPLVGGDHNLAAAAALDPEIRKQIAPELNNAPKVQFVPDMYGNQIPMSVRGGQHPSVEQLPVGGNETSGTGGVGGVGNGALMEQVNGMRAAGTPPEQIVEKLPDNHPAKGVIKAWLEGRDAPQFMGFKAPARQALIMLADAMGLDQGQIKARLQFANDMGNTKSGLGFRVESGKKMLNHFESLADKLEQLHNLDTPQGLPGYLVPDAAVEAANTIGNKPREQQNIANDAKGIAQSFALEKGKFLGGTAGGSMHERDKTVDAYNTNRTRSSLSGALQGDLDLFKGQFGAMESQRDNLLGPNAAHKRFQVTTPEMQAQIQRIQDKIDAIKKGTAAPAPTSATPPRITTQEEYNKLPPGTTYMHPDGQLKTKK